MTLSNTLRTVCQNLASGTLNNEAQVKMAVILPVLRALDWDDSNPQIFKPEYSVENGLVDYALFCNGKPLIFLEAKRLGGLDSGGEDQLFKYASNQGVPFLILTDGNRWDFYLSMAPGRPSERRFYRLQLELAHNMHDYVESLEQFLRRDVVKSGSARLAAELKLSSNLDRERAKAQIRRSWFALLSEPDDLLCDLLIEKVENECGAKPESEDVEKFLKDFGSTTKPTPVDSDDTNGDSPKPIFTGRPKNGKINGFILDGKRVDTKSAIDTLVRVIKAFDAQNPAFMDEFATKTRTKTRNLVARNRTHLYTNPKFGPEYSKDLNNGWWLGSNLSSRDVEKHIRSACNTAGIKFGSQFKLLKS